ncbi:MAG: hypothetical protein ACRDTF_05720, partial [Pseudonocardiaceae bacterium]
MELPTLTTPDIPVWSDAAPEAFSGDVPTIRLARSTKNTNGLLDQPGTICVGPGCLSEYTEIEFCHHPSL